MTTVSLRSGLSRLNRLPSCHVCSCCLLDLVMSAGFGRTASCSRYHPARAPGAASRVATDDEARARAATTWRGRIRGDYPARGGGATPALTVRLTVRTGGKPHP